MPRYFFHIRDGREVVPDEEGIVFPDMCLADLEGHDSARDLAEAAHGERRSVENLAVEVADEAGTVLRRIKLHPISSAA